MPTYGYKCHDCKEEFDVLQKINDDPVSECPRCSGPVRRVFHPVGIIFKGSGFYSTDNRRGESEKAKPAEKETPAPDKASKEKKPSADAKKTPEKAAT